MDKEKVLKLAKLARVYISDEEAEKLTHEFEGILAYVADVKNVVGEAESNHSKPGDFALRNVLREDSNPHESGIYTADILKNAPNADSEYIKVKKILG